MPKKTRVVEEDAKDPFDRAINQLLSCTDTDKIKRKMDEHQRAYYSGIREKRVSIVDDKAGTGKTTIAFISGIEELRKPNGCDKLMYIRFTDDLAQSLGFLPGDKGEKEAPYFNPAYQALAKCGLQRESVYQFMIKEIIEFTTHVHLRGSDYENTFVIIDEAQNAKDIQALKLVLTRFHDNCKIVLIGHSEQTDSKIVKIKNFTPFEVYQMHLLKKSWVQRFELKVDYRGELCRYADNVQDTIASL